jgi:hypothetical protein
VLVAYLSFTSVALAGEDLPANSSDPTKMGLMTPEAKSELDDCIAHAAETAGDGSDHRAMIGIFIGPKGRAVSLAILESSGLEQLDKLILRCIYRAHYIPAESGKDPIYWVFTTSLRARRATPLRDGGGVALLRVPATDTHVRDA